jgi:uncharacterized membrane protein YuzA (DUF378 family)
MKTLQRIALVLTIVGALNWGMVGLFDFDIVQTVFGGNDTMLDRIIYVLISIAGIINIGLFFDDLDEIKK